MTDVDELERLVSGQRKAAQQNPFPSAEARLALLRILRRRLVAQTDAIVRALHADFGHRSADESRLTEVWTVAQAIRHVERRLRRWMRPRRRSGGMLLIGASAHVEPSPLGVVGVIAPWNAPIHLSLLPAVYALAAGNRVVIKPSESAPQAALALHRLVDEIIPAEWLAVVLGGKELGQALSAQPLDHLLYTGSRAAARDVVGATRDTLAGTTLELGGKSPAIVHPSASLDDVAEDLAAGKLFNAGQMCIAPDYVLVAEHQAEAMADAISVRMKRMYGQWAANEHYTSMASQASADRMRSIVDDAARLGAKVIVVEDGPLGESGNRRIPPTLILNVTDEMLAVREELFGPVLPIVSVANVDAALTYVQSRPRPLALYYFDRDPKRIRHVVRSTVSGGIVVNGTMVQAVAKELPFGGIGESGRGAYHGRAGFDLFSHHRSVVVDRRWAAHRWFRPPLTATRRRFLQWWMQR